MTRPLAILLLLLTGCASRPTDIIEEGNPPGLNKPLGATAKMSNRVIVLVVPPALTFTIHPPTAFQVLASPTLAAPRTTWTVIASGTNQLTVPLADLVVFTNAPDYQQWLAWNLPTDPLVVGVNVYYGDAAGHYTNVASAGFVNPSLDPNSTNLVLATNLVIHGLSPALEHYAATSVNAAGLESVRTEDVAGNPVPVASPVVVFFEAAAAIPTTLSVSGP